MKLSALFPSKYLKADDISAPLTVTIKSFTHEEMGQDEEKETKAVMYFSDHAKGMVMNKTKGVLISDLYGDETDNWIGKRITLFKTRVLMRGDMVDSIGVRAPDGAAATTAPVSAPVPEVAPGTEWHGKFLASVQEISGKTPVTGEPFTGWHFTLKSGEKVGTLDKNIADVAKGFLPKDGVETPVDLTVGPGTKPGHVRLLGVQDASDVPF